MDKKIFSLCLRSIVYKEDGLFHARCLEMDLLGVGNSEQAAVEELQNVIEEQIGFAVYKKDDGLILFPADKEYFDRWEKANQAKIHNELFPDSETADQAIKLNGKSIIISFEQSELDKLTRKQNFVSREMELA
jgi:hypothetical protein